MPPSGRPHTPARLHGAARQKRPDVPESSSGATGSSGGCGAPGRMKARLYRKMGPAPGSCTAAGVQVDWAFACMPGAGGARQRRGAQEPRARARASKHGPLHTPSSHLAQPALLQRLCSVHASAIVDQDLVRLLDSREWGQLLLERVDPARAQRSLPSGACWARRGRPTTPCAALTVSTAVPRDPGSARCGRGPP